MRISRWPTLVIDSGILAGILYYVAVSGTDRFAVLLGVVAGIMLRTMTNIVATMAMEDHD